MHRFLAAILCLFVPLTALATDKENSYKVIYDGGSLQTVKAGNGVLLFVDANQIRIVKDKNELVTIPASAVTEISYGEDVHRRIGTAIGLAVLSLGIGAMMLLSKSKKHFIGLTWVNGDAKGGFAMQCDKNEYRGILAALEGITGKKSVDSAAMNVKN